MARAPAGDNKAIHKYDAAADLERKADDLDLKGAAKAGPRDQVRAVLSYAVRSPDPSLRLT